jgi:two-component system response regulator MtrA
MQRAVASRLLARAFGPRAPVSHLGELPLLTMSFQSESERPLVLVADDNADNREIFTAILDYRGYRTASASSGREAVEFVCRERPSLIVMDLVMPGLSGLEALEAIRDDPACEEVPVVLATAQVEFSCEQGKAAGFSAVVYKPVRPLYLADAVQRCLADSEAGLSWTDLPKKDSGAGTLR